jgi:hypothetical protein
MTNRHLIFLAAAAVTMSTLARLGGTPAFALAPDQAAEASDSAEPAEDGPTKVTPADVAKYVQLREAEVLKEARSTLRRDARSKEKAEQDWAKALRAAGWSDEQYQKISEAVGMAASALRDSAQPGEDGDNAKATLAEMDKGTVAAVKARLKDLQSDDALRQKADARAREEWEAERRGAPPTPAKLAGTWAFSLDATVDAIAADMGEEVKQKMRQEMSKTMRGATYTFGPGDKIESVTTAPDGSARTERGTYRVEGNKLFLKAERGKREHELTVGMKGDDTLLVGAFGVYSHFKREKAK